MNTKPIIQLNEKVIPLLQIISLAIGILAIIASLFSGTSYAFVILAYMLSIPSIILSILIITQGKKEISLGLPLATLICNKVAWLVICAFCAFDIINQISKRSFNIFNLLSIF